jgi:hypothetical protein
MNPYLGYRKAVNLKYFFFFNYSDVAQRIKVKNINKSCQLLLTGREVVLAIFYVFYPIFLRSSRETFVSPHYYFA